jgi:DNA-binding response OmpR family regulator
MAIGTPYAQSYFSITPASIAIPICRGELLPVPAKETKKILIIDDEPDTRIFMSNLLSTHGYKSIWAKNRIEGLRKAMAESPLAIIIDMMMPGEGGIQLYRDLMREESLSKVPLIMLTTIDKHTFFKIQGVAQARSGTDVPAPKIYLQKPHETEELLTIIKNISGAPADQSKEMTSGRHP